MQYTINHRAVSQQVILIQDIMLHFNTVPIVLPLKTIIIITYGYELMKILKTAFAGYIFDIFIHNLVLKFHYMHSKIKTIYNI